MYISCSVFTSVNLYYFIDIEVLRNILFRYVTDLKTDVPSLCGDISDLVHYFLH